MAREVSSTPESERYDQVVSLLASLSHTTAQATCRIANLQGSFHGPKGALKKRHIHYDDLKATDTPIAVHNQRFVNRWAKGAALANPPDPRQSRQGARRRSTIESRRAGS